MANTITVDFNANVARFTSAIDKATNDLSKFQANSDRISKNINSSLAGIGIGLSAAGFVTFTMSVIDGLDKLNDLSKTTGIAVGTLSGLGVAAKQSGADLDSVAAAVSKLSVNIGKDGEKFRALGITAKDPLEAFKQLADIFVSIKDPQQRAAVAAAALGKAWQGTAPLLAEGGAAIGRMVTDGEKASGVTTEMAKAAVKFNGQLVLMKAKLAGVGVSIVGDLLPPLNALLDKLKTASQSGGLFGFLNTLPEEENQLGASIESVKLKIGSLKKLRDELTAPTFANKLNNTLLGSLLSGGVSDVKTLDNQIVAAERKLSYLSSLAKKADDLNKPAEPAKAAPSKKAIGDFLGSNSGSNSAAKALAERQKTFIENLQKEATNLGATSVQLKLYEAGILKITGAKLQGVKLDAQKIEDYKLEQTTLQGMRDAYASSADAYLKFIQAMESDNKSARDKVERLKVELGLMDKSEAQRNKALAQYDLEIKYKEKLAQLNGLDTGDSVRKIQEESLAKAKANEEEVGRFQEQIDTQKTKAAEMQKVWDNFSFNIQRNLGDQLFQILDGNFKNIGASFASMMKRMLADALAAKLSSAILGGKDGGGLLKAGLSIFGSLLGAGGGAKTGNLKVMGGGLTGFAAKGAYFDGNVAKFALGDVVNSPTPFQFASGGAFRPGLMGEAGPEAIMPLKRDSAGRLGVSGGGRSASVNYAPVINIDSRSDRTEVHAIVSRAVKQGNADLVEKLNRQGVI